MHDILQNFTTTSNLRRFRPHARYQQVRHICAWPCMHYSTCRNMRAGLKIPGPRRRPTLSESTTVSSEEFSQYRVATARLGIASGGRRNIHRRNQSYGICHICPFENFGGRCNTRQGSPHVRMCSARTVLADPMANRPLLKFRRPHCRG